MGDRFRRRLDPFRTCESRERTRSRAPPGSDSIVTRSCKTVGSTTRPRRSTRTRSRSLSRRATSFETARSCTSRHQPVFVKSGRRVPLEPALQVSPRHVEQLRVRLERDCDCPVQGQAALLYPLVAAPANSMVALLAFPAEPTFAPGEGPAQGAAILIRT
jgi:hypothetical protein